MWNGLQGNNRSGFFSYAKGYQTSEKGRCMIYGYRAADDGIYGAGSCRDAYGSTGNRI